MVRRKGKSRKRAIIVITDGDPQDSKRIPKIVKSLKMKNTAVFAVGIGSASKSELSVVADGNDDFVFYADNYASAQAFESRLVRYICKATGFGKGINLGENVDLSLGPVASPKMPSICPTYDYINDISKVNRIFKTKGYKFREFKKTAYRLDKGKIKTNTQQFPEEFELNMIIKLHGRTTDEASIPLFQVGQQTAGRKTVPFSVSLVDSESLEISRLMSGVNYDRVVYQGAAMRKIFNRKYHQLTVRVNHYGAEVFVDCVKIDGLKSNNNPTYADLDGRVSILADTGGRYYSPKVDFQSLELKCDVGDSCSWPPKSLKKRKNSENRSRNKSKSSDIDSSAWPRRIEKVVVTSRAAVKNRNHQINRQINRNPEILKVLDHAVTQMSITESSPPNLDQNSFKLSANEGGCSCSQNQVNFAEKQMISKEQCTRIVQQNLNQLSSLLQASYASLVDDSLTGG